MKLGRKAVWLVMAACLAFGFTGCKGAANTPADLEILIWDSGYGVEWLNDIADAFQQKDWVKEKYPDLTVSIGTTKLESTAANKIPLGAKNNSVDLFFASSSYALMEPDSNGKEYVLDLTDVVYGEKVPGEDVRYSDKILDSYLKSMSYVDNEGNVKYLAAPWAGGMNGILYNADILESLGEDVPLTTDELLAICGRVKGLKDNTQGKYGYGHSFICSYEADYSNYTFPIWWAQYQTVEGYENFYQGIDGRKISREVFNQKGRLYAAEVMEQIFKATNGYNYAHFKSTEYIVAQTMMLQGKAVFMMNGDWFDNEMRDIAATVQENGSNAIKIMKTPILSEMVNLTPSVIQYAVDNGLTNDQALAAVVKAVDEGTAAPNGVSAEDFARVQDARKVISTIGPSHLTFIPEYAVAKDAAVDFVRFLATDEANVLYTSATQGASLPFKVDVETLSPAVYAAASDFQKSRIDIFSDFENINVLTIDMYFPLRRFGNVRYFYDVNGFADPFGSSSNPRTAEDIFNETKEYWTTVRWDSAKALAGITG